MVYVPFNSSPTLLLTPGSNLMPSGVVLALHRRAVLGMYSQCAVDHALPSQIPSSTGLIKNIKGILSHRENF